MEDSRILSIKNVYDVLCKAGTVGVSVSIRNDASKVPATEKDLSDILQLPLTSTERSDYQISYKNLKDIVDFSKTSRYQRREYIESTGTQFVDTGFKPSNLTSYVLDMQFVSAKANSDNHFFSVNATNTYFALRLSANKTSFSVRWGKGALAVLPHSGNLTDRHVFTCNKGIFQCDDSEPVSFEPTVFTQPQTISLFTFTNNTGAHSSNSCIKIYSLQMYEDGELVRDMVPCYDTQSNTRGLYDFVRQTFTKNGGSGAFTLGPQTGYIIDPNS